MQFIVPFFVLLCFQSVVISAAENKGKIVGGQVTTIDKVPYQVALYRYHDRLSQCGGTIIHQYAVLTAAHCVVGLYVDEVTFSAGSNDNNRTGSLHRADWIVTHWDYDYTTLRNDIAFVKVVEPFVFGTNVRAASLPTATPPSGTLAVASGWGPLYVDGAKLHSVSIPIVDLATCQARYASFELRPSADMICAGPSTVTQGPCEGDVGGPLVINNILVGVFTWSNGCGSPQYPSVFSSVAYFRAFVDEYISYIRP